MIWWPHPSVRSLLPPECVQGHFGLAFTHFRQANPWGSLTTLAWRDSIAAGTLTGPQVRAAGTIIESQRWVDAVIGMLEGRGAPDVIAELRGRFALATPADALRAADSLHAMRADFAKIRNGDPLADIRATRRVHAVVARGKLYDRRALDVLLSVAR